MGNLNFRVYCAGLGIHCLCFAERTSHLEKLLGEKDTETVIASTQALTAASPPPSAAVQQVNGTPPSDERREEEIGGLKEEITKLKGTETKWKTRARVLEKKVLKKRLKSISFVVNQDLNPFECSDCRLKSKLGLKFNFLAYLNL